MSREDLDLCSYCCKWANSLEGKSPAAVRDAYPKMMRRVLKEWFGMPKKASKRFIGEACNGNWRKIHETDVEREAEAEFYADELRGDVWYCSDRWSWDRVLRVQWLYMKRLVDRCRDWEERDA